MENKLAVFDFDSTLMDGETIEIIAREVGLQAEVAEITHRAMAGELDFFDSLTYRVSLLKGLQEKKVDEICQNLPYMTGAKETITELKKHNFVVVCFSARRRGSFNSPSLSGKNGSGIGLAFPSFEVL